MIRKICGRTCGCDDLCPRAEAAIDDSPNRYDDYDGRLADGAAADMVYGRDPW